jgi:hypothetical protein
MKKFNIFCLVGKHDWVNIRKDRPNPKKGGVVAWSALHRCQKCGKEEVKGMGWEA